MSSPRRRSSAESPQVGGPDAELRVSLAVSHLVGVAVLRYVIGVPSPVKMPSSS